MDKEPTIAEMHCNLALDCVEGRYSTKVLEGIMRLIDDDTEESVRESIDAIIPFLSHT